MTREQLRGIIEGITDQQLKAILDINSADTGKAKQNETQLKQALEESENKVSQMVVELNSLRESQGEAEEIKKQYTELQKVLDQKTEEQRISGLKNRFGAVAGDAQFLNSYTREGVFSEFVKALDLEENQGKSDAEIYEALTGDSESVFKTSEEMPRVVESTMGFGGDLTDGDIREIMGLSSQLP